MTRDRLRAFAVARTLFPPTTLARAVARLGFVQADPIRAPATAQDLVLRHRVRGYRAGDLERRYASLGLEEGYLYAYGFLTPDIARALHPRATAPPRAAFDKRVLAVVRELGHAHPSDVADAIGHARVVNAWGGQSKATTHALERLHRHGLLRVARRERGVRVYAPAPPFVKAPKPARLRTLVLAIVNVLAPVLERTLRANVTRFRHLGDPRGAIDALVHDGTLVRESIDGALYLWPRERAPRTSTATRGAVRFLAPFDPLVWDRRRFEHLFGWPYRFEAYTPQAKRIRGYYAMPLLFEDDVVGWANAPSGAEIEIGFVEGRRPTSSAFAAALEAEIVRIRTISGKVVGST